jgi:NAD-dependent dihydropyrimidine dehydrogenase PreA subunit
MRLLDFPYWLRDTMLRMFPHRAPTGLIRIGKPGRDSPVVLTGNFTLTVRRLLHVLKGQDAWLLCANSKGINVWCAAGGGHLTHHDVISVLRTSRIDEQVDHRELILPQLCATGVEGDKIVEVTGWSPRWGPARVEDLTAFLKRGHRVTTKERFMRFPLWERMEMALMWAWAVIVIAALMAWGVGSWALAVSLVAVIGSIVGGLFAALPWIGVTGTKRWLTFVVFAAAGFFVGAGLLAALGSATPAHLWIAAATAAASMGVLSVDLAGTTPWYGSYINTFHNEAHIDLVEERCTGAAVCVEVCPRDVLHMNGRRRKVEIKRGDDCIQCGACIVQCPEDALRFRYDDNRVVEAATIRRTRMNMLGRRTVDLPEP